MCKRNHLYTVHRDVYTTLYTHSVHVTLTYAFCTLTDFSASHCDIKIQQQVTTLSGSLRVGRPSDLLYTTGEQRAVYSILYTPSVHSHCDISIHIKHNLKLQSVINIRLSGHADQLIDDVIRDRR